MNDHLIGVTSFVSKILKHVEFREKKIKTLLCDENVSVA